MWPRTKNCFSSTTHWSFVRSTRESEFDTLCTGDRARGYQLIEVRISNEAS
jgi:hypothetical protein